MSCDRHQKMKAVAVQMRRAGATYEAIQKEVGVGRGTLSRWLHKAGVTRTRKSSPGMKHKALSLRRQGTSYDDIERELGVPKSTLSSWLKDEPLTEEQRRLLEAHVRGNPRRAAAVKAQAQVRRQSLSDQAAQQIGALSSRELFLAGVVLYWAEGTKAKPWRTQARVTLVNSDADVVRLFLAWLELVGVGREGVVFRLQIHEAADIDRAERYWAQVAGVDPGVFRRATLKRHNPRTPRRNTGDAYYGCLTMSVRCSTELYWNIDGWFKGIASQMGRRPKAGHRTLAPGMLVRSQPSQQGNPSLF